MKIIRISALWCMSCLVMRSRLDSTLKKLEISHIEDLDFDEDSDKIKKYNPGSILPIIIIFINDKEVMRFNGEVSKKQLEKALKEVRDEVIA